jgi:hypothetical protein
VKRRINTNHKFKEKHQLQQQSDIEHAKPEPKQGDKNTYQETHLLDNKEGPEGCLQVTAAIKILAGELESGGHEDTLCRAAVRLAEDGGIIDSCRARWDAEQENAACQSSTYLFDRRQCLELIRFHQNKGNNEALKKEKDKLRILEGRLLLGQKPPLKITEEDLEKLEEFIRESGF